MIKILTVLGARPQFIKASALSRAFVDTGLVNEVIVHTGQHYDNDMSDIFFEELNIPRPTYSLQIGGVAHGAMTGRMMEGIENLAIKEKPDYILVFGDTNSTLAGALVAAKLRISMIHVEAGLRSFNMNMPEEVNRILTDRVSDLLFCPTDTAVQNLNNEGFKNFGSSIYRVGDVMHDVALYHTKNAIHPKTDNFLLFTLHRQENTADQKRFENIIDAINSVVKIFDVNVVWPIHPRIKQLIKNYDLDERVITTKPLGYLEMIGYLEKSKGVITDSGGLQKEAYFFKKYCITIREETEWVELVENGFNILSEPEDVVAHLTAILNKEFISDNMLYGGGNASQEITEHIINHHKGIAN